jgi:hypothetical protein
MLHDFAHERRRLERCPDEQPLPGQEADSDFYGDFGE